MDPTAEQARVDVDLPPDVTAPAVARRALRRLLAPVRLRTALDAVLVVTSELVTNAVRHGAPPVRLTVRVRHDDVSIAVHDLSPCSPAPRVPDEDAESGRGMAIVAHLATETGLRVEPAGGKTVWARFALHRAQTRQQADERVPRG